MYFASPTRPPSALYTPMYSCAMLSASDGLGRTATTVSRVKPWIAALLDLICVVAFVALGIQNHAESDSLLKVAAPFVAALAVAWIVAAPLRAPETLKAGGVIWLVTLVGGMLLRRVTGEGTAFTFILVAAGFLAVTMLGWRAISGFLRGRSTPVEQ